MVRGMDRNIRRAKVADRRALVLDEREAGTITLAQAALLLGLSERQVTRLRAAYRQAGAGGLAHGNRGRVPWNALAPRIRERLLELARTRYLGFNAQHLAERLAEDEGIVLHRTTVRRLLVAAGDRPARLQRVPARRSRRERMPREGLLLQGDGSRHRWLGEDAPYLTLIGFIDDATGTLPAAVFRAQEDAAGYLLVLRDIVCTKGRPSAVYVDRHGIFKKSLRDPLTLEEELAGGQLPTQVARALEELEVRLILAHSPQAKGRVERLWRTLQDRLGAELRLAGIATMDDANTFLPSFLTRFNTRFAVPAAEPDQAYRSLPDTFEPDRVFCFKYERVVRPDNTLLFGTRVLQLHASDERASWARARVQVHERLDTTLAVYYQDTLLLTAAAPPDAPTLRARAGPRPGAGVPQAPASPSTIPVPRPSPRPPWKPAASHPWRRSLLPPPPPPTPHG